MGWSLGEYRRAFGGNRMKHTKHLTKGGDCWGILFVVYVCVIVFSVLPSFRWAYDVLGELMLLLGLYDVTCIVYKYLVVD